MSAKQIYYIVLAALAAVGTSVAQALGGWDAPLKMLVVMMGIDYITGVLCAAVWHNSPKTPTGAYDSRIGLKGLLRKGAILLVVLISAELDDVMGTTITRTAVILFFIANDGFSIIENLGIMGVPFPDSLKRAFEVLRKQSNGEEKEMKKE